ncbi:MAG: tetratricopeptide repeat protein [Cyanobacteria bacterium P01_A01_bin.45]
MNQILVAGYRIIQLLSGNDNEKKYLAEDTSNLHSLPVILTQLNSINDDLEELERIQHSFLSEAELLIRISKGHNQIQNLLNAFEKDNIFYLIKELVGGDSIESKIGKNILLSEQEIIDILIEVLEIIEFIHGNGVIHGNIRPKNIIFRKSDNKLVLTDFGAIKQVITNIIDDPLYAPMEQNYGKSLLNSDIYTLGIIAIVALTGLPVEEITSLNSPKNLFTGEIIWRNRTRKVSNQLAKIINKMVRTDYRDRYQSATEVLRDLHQIQKGEPQPFFSRFNRLKLVLISLILSATTIGVLSWLIPVSNNLTYSLENAAKPFYEQGVVEYAKSNYQGAVNKFTQAIEKYPEYSQAYNRRADAFYNIGNYDKALEDSTTAIRLNPEDANAYYDRGFSLYTIGEYNGALIDYRKAIKINSENASAYYGRGLARSMIKEKDKAIEDFTKAISLNPQYGAAYLERGIVRLQLGQKSEALQDMDEAIKLDTVLPTAYYERAKVNNALNQKQAAIEDLSKAIELDSKYLEAYIARGDIHKDLGDNPKAIADYSKVLEIDPKFAAAYLHRGMYYFYLSNPEQAIEDYTKAIELDPKEAAAYNNRANAYLFMGDYNQAMVDYTKAIEANPDYALAYFNRATLGTDLGKVPQAIEDFQKAADLFLANGEQNNYNDAMAKIKAFN